MKIDDATFWSLFPTNLKKVFKFYIMFSWKIHSSKINNWSMIKTSTQIKNNTASM